MWFQNIIETLFGLALFANAVLFIPQAVRLCKTKDSSEISLVTFMGFNAIQILIILHGFIVKDYLLISGYFLSFLTCGLVTALTIFYRLRSASDLNLGDQNEI